MFSDTIMEKGEECVSWDTSLPQLQTQSTAGHSITATLNTARKLNPCNNPKINRRHKYRKRGIKNFTTPGNEGDLSRKFKRIYNQIDKNQETVLKKYLSEGTA